MLICPESFFISDFDPCISQGRFFGPIFRQYKVDLYMGKYGRYFSATIAGVGGQWIDNYADRQKEVKRPYLLLNTSFSHK